MNRLYVTFFALAITASVSFAESIVVPIRLVSPSGAGESIGEITLTESDAELVLTPNLKKLSPGQHGFHIHENPSCEPGMKDGVSVAALAAGPHFDPEHSGKHMGPEGAGHHGDLPVIEVADSGEAKISVTAARLKLSQIHNRSIIIHESGDNYSDTPKPLGGAGARIACGVIP